MRTPEKARQARCINDERPGWFLCRFSDRNAARMPRLLVLAIEAPRTFPVGQRVARSIPERWPACPLLVRLRGSRPSRASWQRCAHRGTDLALPYLARPFAPLGAAPFSPFQGCPPAQERLMEMIFGIERWACLEITRMRAIRFTQVRMPAASSALIAS